jgi:hypothetical protein
MFTCTAVATFVALSANAFDAGVIVLGDGSDATVGEAKAALLEGGAEGGRLAAGRFLEEGEWCRLEGELRLEEGGAMFHWVEQGVTFFQALALLLGEWWWREKNFLWPPSSKKWKICISRYHEISRNIQIRSRNP